MDGTKISRRNNNAVTQKSGARNWSVQARIDKRARKRAEHERRDLEELIAGARRDGRQEDYDHLVFHPGDPKDELIPPDVRQDIRRHPNAKCEITDWVDDP